MIKNYKLSGMHCNSCAMLIEKSLENKVNRINASFSKEEVKVDFDEKNISEKEIIEEIEKLGYQVKNKHHMIEKDIIKNESLSQENPEEDEEIIDAQEIKTENSLIKAFKKSDSSTRMGWVMVIISFAIFAFVLYYYLLRHLVMPEMSVQELGDNASIFLLFFAGILAGFHCVSMCGAFVISYTTKNAQNGYKGYKQHIVYGGSKVISYAIIGGIFGLIGGFIAFNTGLRGTVAILAGVFMIFYALSMFGFKFFRKFQINPKFLTRMTSKAQSNAKGPYKAPFVTGILNGLFIACGPLQAMYLYAAGTGSFAKGAIGLAAFGIGTLPVMIGFGSIATVISHNTTKKILKFSAIIVLILGIVMLNRGLTVLGSPYSFDSIKQNIINPSTNSGNNANIITPIVKDGVQEINMDVSGSGYSPDSFVIKKGIPVKWNVNVKQLTGCNQELVLNKFGIDKNLQPGLNIIEFTPDKEGTITFSCGMGMLKGSFIVE